MLVLVKNIIRKYALFGVFTTFTLMLMLIIFIAS